MKLSTVVENAWPIYQLPMSLPRTLPLRRMLDHIHQTARPWKGTASSRAEKSIELNGFSRCGASSGGNVNLTVEAFSRPNKKAAPERCLLSSLVN
jgi:hypothetical protein